MNITEISAELFVNQIYKKMLLWLKLNIRIFKEKFLFLKEW